MILSEVNRTTSDREGRFLFGELRPGTYYVDATLIGYASEHVAVSVSDNLIVEVTIKLRIAAVRLNINACPIAPGPHETNKATIDRRWQIMLRGVRMNVGSAGEASRTAAARSPYRLLYNESVSG